MAKTRKAGTVLGRPRVICSHSKVLALREAGRSYAAIAAEMGLSVGNVYRVVKQAGA